MTTVTSLESYNLNYYLLHTMDTPMTLAQRLFLFQGEVEAITKDATNPFFKSKYFDINGLLSEIKPLLQKHGLVVLQPFGVVDGRTTLNTMIINADDKNEYTESSMLLPENIDPQKMGSAITYFRRYALQSMLLLEAEDDDGEQTTNHIHKPATYTVNSSAPLPPEPVVHSDEEPKSIYTQKCPKCSKTMLLRPAGVSKTTGKSYKAFYSCTQECKTTVPLNTY